MVNYDKNAIIRNLKRRLSCTNLNVQFTIKDGVENVSIYNGGIEIAAYTSIGDINEDPKYFRKWSLYVSQLFLKKYA